MYLQIGADHDHRTSAIINALAQQILAETTLLTFQHIAEALEPMLALPTHGTPAPPIINQGIDRLLEHTLLIADNNFRRMQFNQALQPIIAIDHPSIQIVQITGRKSSTIKLYHRPQIRWNHRQHGQDHPCRVVATLAKALDHP